jgi:hypothetical protein
MPRGNDAEQAQADLVANYGAIPNAEDLIAQHRAMVDPHAVAAGMKGVNDEATKELDYGTVDVPEGHKVLAGAVRGDSEVYVVKDQNGVLYKLHQPASDDYEPPPMAEDTAVQRAQYQLQQKVEADVAGVQAEVDKELAEAQAAANEKLTAAREEAMAKYKEELPDATEAAAEEASGEPAPKPKGGGKKS